MARVLFSVDGVRVGGDDLLGRLTCRLKLDALDGGGNGRPSLHRRDPNQRAQRNNGRHGADGGKRHCQQGNASQAAKGGGQSRAYRAHVGIRLQLLCAGGAGEIAVKGAERKMAGFAGKFEDQTVGETKRRFCAEQLDSRRDRFAILQD